MSDDAKRGSTSWQQVLRTRPAMVMLVVSAILRAVYSAWAVLPYSDGETYDRLARGLVAAGTYGSPESWAPKSPGYPFFLAAVYEVFGDHHAPLYFVQHAIDLGTAVIVLAIALEWGLSRKEALLAFGIALFNPFTLFWASVVLSETISMFVFTLALWFAIRITSDSAWKRWAAFGAAMSVLALIRPAFAALAPAVLLGVLLTRRATFKRWVRGSVFAGVAFIAVWAPWGMRNAARYHHLVPYHVGDEQPRAGYNSWCYTWVYNMLDVYGAFWSKPPQIPERAFISAAERAEVESLLQRRPTDADDPAGASVDARFGELARERRSAAPVRYWVVLPAKRATSLWFTREVTILAQANVRTDELRDAMHTRPIALTLKLTLYALMPLLPVLMLSGAVRLFRAGKTTVVLPIIAGATMTTIIEYLMLLKPSFLVVMEPRYVIEFFPPLTPAIAVALAALAAVGVRLWQRVRKRDLPVAPAEQPD